MRKSNKNVITKLLPVILVLSLTIINVTQVCAVKQWSDSAIGHAHDPNSEWSNPGYLHDEMVSYATTSTVDDYAKVGDYGDGPWDSITSTDDVFGFNVQFRAKYFSLDRDRLPNIRIRVYVDLATDYYSSWKYQSLTTTPTGYSMTWTQEDSICLVSNVYDQSWQYFNVQLELYSNAGNDIAYVDDLCVKIYYD